MKILLVDDSKTMRTVQSKILTQLGYSEIREAENGVDAWNKVEELMPELILLDWNMPEMNGLEFLKKLRASGETVPVIMVTTESEKARVIEAVKAGVNNYVIKPFTPDQIGTVIDETLKAAA